MKPEGAILALNGGSSSLKYALYLGDQELFRGEIDQVKNDAKTDFVATLDGVLAELKKAGRETFEAVGHRLVHGGPKHLEPAHIDAAVRKSLEESIPFAPLHLPSELKLIDAVSKRLPDVPQVACFDTAFHRGLPDVTKRLAIPEELFAKGIWRYGFHGLSYEFVVDELGLASKDKVVIAHLGSGSSLAAVSHGKSVDTTMAFTPTAGLVMSTRCGDLDPGVLIYLLSHEGYDARSLERLLDHQSGMLALSQSTGDVKTLLAKRGSDPRAKLALDAFCQSICKGVGAMAAVLGGLDMLVFTGGIGAHAGEIRAQVCEKLAHLGVALDAEKNAKGSRALASQKSRCEIHALQTNEEKMIARAASRVLA